MFEVSHESGSAVDPAAESAMSWMFLAPWASESAERTAPAPNVIALWTAVRCLRATSAVSSLRTKGSAELRSPADKR